MKVERVPGPARWQCSQCAYDLATRMTDVALAEHAVHHRKAHHIAARFRNVPIERSELEAYTWELERLVAELKLVASEQRGEIIDLAAHVAFLLKPQWAPYDR